MRFDTGGACTSEPVDRGLCLLHLERASEREEQHPWRRWESERGPD